MKKGKLIVIEGTDCSGKESQSNLLVNYLNSVGKKTVKFCFPDYSSPTGKIIAGAFLGKVGYMQPVFPEGASNVNPYCSSLLYALDRVYNVGNIVMTLNSGTNVVLDRYVMSNMAYQGAKFDAENQAEFINFVEALEYDLLKLPRPDFQILLYMPLWASKKLKAARDEKPDQNEQDEDYLLRVENVYLKMVDDKNLALINCVNGNQIKTKQQISDELCSFISKKL